jgi:hypothetical protein
MRKTFLRRRDSRSCTATSPSEYLSTVQVPICTPSSRAMPSAKDGFAVAVKTRNLSFTFASGELYGHRVITQCGMPALLTGQIKMQLRQDALMGVNFSPSG